MSVSEGRAVLALSLSTDEAKNERIKAFFYLWLRGERKKSEIAVAVTNWPSRGGRRWQVGRTAGPQGSLQKSRPSLFFSKMTSQYRQRKLRHHRD